MNKSHHPVLLSFLALIVKRIKDRDVDAIIVVDDALNIRDIEDLLSCRFKCECINRCFVLGEHKTVYVRYKNVMWAGLNGDCHALFYGEPADYISQTIIGVTAHKKYNAYKYNLDADIKEIIKGRGFNANNMPNVFD